VRGEVCPTLAPDLACQLGTGGRASKQLVVAAHDHVELRVGISAGPRPRDQDLPLVPGDAVPAVDVQPGVVAVVLRRRQAGMAGGVDRDAGSARVTRFRDRLRELLPVGAVAGDDADRLVVDRARRQRGRALGSHGIANPNVRGAGRRRARQDPQPATRARRARGEQQDLRHGPSPSISHTEPLASTRPARIAPRRAVPHAGIDGSTRPKTNTELEGNEGFVITASLDVRRHCHAYGRTASTVSSYCRRPGRPAATVNAGAPAGFVRYQGDGTGGHGHGVVRTVGAR
jgi:hypothetical protein